MTSRLLVTGHDGYVGAVLVPMLMADGHEVTGLDTALFAGCGLGPEPEPIPSVEIDVRDVEPRHLEGFDAVIHLAGLSNDPLGEISPTATLEINHRGSVRLVMAARRAGVERIVLASSCSVYGAAGSRPVTEETPPRPTTAYARSKLLMERDVGALAGDSFSPVVLRQATVHGFSPRFRGDLVVNNLAGYAWTAGEVLIKSDGTPWRPVVHVEDIARAVLAVLRAPREAVHGQVFNVGADDENYRVADLARIVSEAVEGSTVVMAPGGGPDLRSYRVSFDKLASVVPSARPRWTVRRGVEELIAAFHRHGLSTEAFLGPRLSRIATIRSLLAEGRVREDLRPVREKAMDG